MKRIFFRSMGRHVLDGFYFIFFCIVFFIAINFIFVYFSPSIVPHLPVDIVRGIPPCYRTLYHDKLSSTSSTTAYEIVLGDSHTEGAGDEFISGEKDPGFFRKLSERVEREFIIFGRGGYGSLAATIEEERCSTLLDKYTQFDYDHSRISNVSFVFYEGNDLEDNLVQANFFAPEADGRKIDSDFKYQARFFLPLAEYVVRKIRSSLFANSAPGNRARSENDWTYPTTNTGLKLERYPQSAALALSTDELQLSLDILEESLRRIQKKYPRKAHQLIYIPAVASSYNFSGKLPVQGYNGIGYFVAESAQNQQRSNEIRARLEKMAAELGWKFCDVTESFLERTGAGIAIHGPIDWDHPNRIGYEIIASQYIDCFEEG